MSTVDSRIVTMKFDNKSFEKGAADTLTTLGKLKHALDLGATSKGLSSLSGATKGLSLGGLSASIDGVSGKFLALSTIAVTALSQITSAALRTAGTFLKEFSGIDAAMEGFSEYETNINSIQTILANTDGSSLRDVNKALAELNHYSDQTIYNFGEMAKNIGTFTAAGIDLEASTAAIKGIANLAAISGSNSQQASTAMYQLSQALANGKVSLMDWNSVVNAGMGGKVFQEALFETGKALGTIADVPMDQSFDQWKNAGNSFRDSLQDGWVTADVLTNTLHAFTGDLTKAQLMSMGYTDEQAKAMIRLGKQGQAAAQDVKTLTQLMSTLKEAMASGWSKTWSLIFGDFNEAKKMFTDASNTLGGFIQRSAEARNAVLADWKKAGGRTALIESISNIFQALVSVLTPIRDAFREIFPPATGKQLADLTKAFRDFTEGLILSDENAERLKNTFMGVFSVLKIAGVIIGGVVKYVAEFFGILVGGGGGDAILAITGAIGKLVTKIHDWLMEGAKLEKFFDMITDARNAVLEPVVGVIGKIVEALVELASGDVSGFFDKLAEGGTILADLFEVVQSRLGSFAGFVSETFGSLAEFFGSLGQGSMTGLVTLFENLSTAVADIKEQLSFGDVDMSVDGGPIAQITSQLEGLSWVATAATWVWDKLVAVFQGVGNLIGPTVAGLGDLFGEVTEMITRFVSDLDFTDVIALIQTGVLAKLAWSISGFFDGLKEVIGIGSSIRDTFDQVTSGLKTMQNGIRVGMVKDIAIAVALLAASIIGLSLIPKDKLAVGLGAITGLMGQVVLLIGIMGKLAIGPSLLLVGPAMIGIALGLTILAGALHLYKSIKPADIGKMALSLTALTVALALLGAVGPAVALGGAALVGAATAMLIAAPAIAGIALALRLFEKTKWETIVLAGMALGTVAGGLTLMIAALPGAAALLIAAPALALLATSLKLVAKVEPQSIFKMGVVLGVLAGGLTAMIAAMPGAIALTITAGALTLLMIPLKQLGEMDLENIVKMLAGLAGVFAVLGVAGVLLAPVTPILILLGIAVGLLGAGMLAAGAGFLAFATGFATLATVGSAGVAVLTQTIDAILAQIPAMMKRVGEGVVAFAKVISESGPVLVKAIQTLLVSMYKAAQDTAPEWGKTMTTLIKVGLKVLRDTSPDWVKTGFKLLLDFLKGIRDNIAQISSVATDIIIRFLGAIAKDLPRIINAGFSLLIAFIHGVTSAVRERSSEIGAAGGDLAVALANGMIQGIWAAAGQVATEAKNMAAKALAAAMEILNNLPSAREIFDNLKQRFSGAHGELDGPEKEKFSSSVASAFNEALARVNADFEAGVNPVISPVLDLTQFQRDAGLIAGMLGTKPLSASVSYGRAVAISEDRERAAAEASPGYTVIEEVKFEQVNNSPEPLDDVTLYRQTKNQVSWATEVLKTI